MYAYRLSEHALIWINTKLRGVDLTDKVPGAGTLLGAGEASSSFPICLSTESTVIKSKGRCYVRSRTSPQENAALKKGTSRRMSGLFALDAT